MQKRDKGTHLACIESCTRLFGSIPAILRAQLRLTLLLKMDTKFRGPTTKKKQSTFPVSLPHSSLPFSDGLAQAKERACGGKWAESSGE